MHSQTKHDLSVAIQDLEGVLSRMRSESDEILGSKDHLSIIRHYDDMRLANERMKHVRKALDEMAEQWSREFVPDAMRAKQIKTINLEGVGRVTISARWSASIVEGQKEPAFTWLRESGDGGIIQETVNSSTLSAFAKTKFEAGYELPAHLFKVGQMTFTSITKPK